jgi:hypothetical protein
MEIMLDRTYYPMLWIENIKAYMHLLPITKVQFERYLADPNFVNNASFYNDMLLENPRISPQQITQENYWQVIITGVPPTEALRFATWLGTEFDLPTAEEWARASIYLQAVSLEHISLILEKSYETNPLFTLTFNRLRSNLLNKTTIDTLLMNNGVMEWVKTGKRDKPWGGLGQPNRHLQVLFSPPSYKSPLIPYDYSNPSNIHYFGFRLLYRKYQ